MPEPHLRAADVDRAAVAEALGAHMSAGRLTLAEYDDRLARAYAARTYGELDALTTDLPALHGSTSTGMAASAPASRPAASACAAPAAWSGGWDQGHSWRAWVTTGLIVLTIWAATSLASWEFQYFWPIWVIGPWGAVLLAHSIAGRRSGAPRGSRELRG